MPIRGGEKGIFTRAGLLVAALSVLTFPSAASAATIAPNHTADDPAITNDGDCSLRDAVRSMVQEALQDTCANSVPAQGFGTNDTIALTAGAVYVLDQNGSGGAHDSTTGDLDIDGEDLTITGNAANRPTIRGGVAFDDRILHAQDATTSLTLQDLIIDDGKRVTGGENIGGNIYYSSGETLLLDHVDVTDGRVDLSAGNLGGGIAADNGGHVMVTNTSLVSNNVAGPAPGVPSQGGGIYITGVGTDLTVSTFSAVSNNKAGVSDGVDIPNIGQGGGIWVDATNSTVNISNSAIDMNEVGGGAIGVGGQGGAIGVNSASANPSIGPSVSVSNNRAGGGFDNATGSGGGIYAVGAGTLTLGDGTVVADNDAGGGGMNAEGQGGGVFTAKALTINGAFVSSNDAAAEVGGNGFGGGIRMDNAALMITDGTIIGNRVGTTGGSGGGIYHFSNAVIAPLTISTSQINNNMARDFGGGMYRETGGPQPGLVDSVSTTTLSGNTANIRGGGIAAVADGTLNLRRSTMTMNTAGVTGVSAGQGGALDLRAGGFGAASTYLIENSTIHQNTAAASGATGGSGGGVHLPSIGGDLAPHLTIRGSTITSNTAIEGTTMGTGLGGNLRTDVNAINSMLITVRGSIVSNGVGSAGHQNCSSDFAGSFLSEGGNIESLNQCSFGQPSDLTGTDPMLGPLQPNGGPTDTRAITAASPAFNRVPAGLCPPPTIDQVGLARPQGAACDSGAFELFVAPPVVTPTTPPSTVPTTTTTAPPPAKKCKKGRKLKKGKCVKKKRKKRR